jgi:hypothetical protein
MKCNSEEFENIPEPKYPNGFLLHWVIDDMIGSNIFKMASQLLQFSYKK